MRKLLGFVFGICLAFSAPSARAQSGKTLNISVVDVEGGNATLFVAPSGESVLIDTGNPRRGRQRDADRIMAAVKDAGVTQIDNLITTHWHGDHFGGMAEPATRIQIQDFIDHGPNVQPGAAPDDFYRAIQSLSARPSTWSPSLAINSRLAASTGASSVCGRGNRQAAARRWRARSGLLDHSTRYGRGWCREQHVRRQRRHFRKVLRAPIWRPTR